MDYHSKYLKYKKRYLNLKKILIDNLTEEELISLPDNFFEQLEKIYPTTQMDNFGSNELYDGHQTTYGEMEYEGMRKILTHLKHNNVLKFDYFIDLGSGRGKLSLQLAGLPNIKKSIGIEIVKERHEDAEKMKKKLMKFKEFTDKVVFINDDFNKVDLSEYINGVTLVWLSNLCFSQELTDKIFKKLIDVLPPNSIIACTREHLISSPQVSKFGTLQIPMSWNKESTVNLYKIEE